MTPVRLPALANKFLFFFFFLFFLLGFFTCSPNGHNIESSTFLIAIATHRYASVKSFVLFLARWFTFIFSDICYWLHATRFYTFLTTSHTLFPLTKSLPSLQKSPHNFAVFWLFKLEPSSLTQHRRPIWHATFPFFQGLYLTRLLTDSLHISFRHTSDHCLHAPLLKVRSAISPAELSPLPYTHVLEALRLSENAT